MYSSQHNGVLTSAEVFYKSYSHNSVTSSHDFVASLTIFRESSKDPPAGVMRSYDGSAV